MTIKVQASQMLAGGFRYETASDRILGRCPLLGEGI